MYVEASAESLAASIDESILDAWLARIYYYEPTPRVVFDEFYEGVRK